MAWIYKVDRTWSVRFVVAESVVASNGSNQPDGYLPTADPRDSVICLGQSLAFDSHLLWLSLWIGLIATDSHLLTLLDWHELKTGQLASYTPSGEAVPDIRAKLT